jgi:hypothetical protein
MSLFETWRESHAERADARESHRDGTLSRGRRATGYLLITVVMGAVAAMSFSNLYRFGHVTLGWSPGHAVLVPIALDVAALACAALALDSVSRGELATGYRLLTAVLVALSAFINWRTVLGTHNLAEQVFFPAMAILSYGLIHLTLGKYRRDSRNDREGRTTRQAVAPLPRLGVASWLPGIGYPGRALAAVRASIAARVPPAGGPDDATRRADVAAGYLAGLSQADAIRAAMRDAGLDSPREVVAWLADHGWPGVATSRVHDVIRRDKLRAVESGGTEQAS